MAQNAGRRETKVWVGEKAWVKEHLPSSSSWPNTVIRKQNLRVVLSSIELDQEKKFDRSTLIVDSKWLERLQGLPGALATIGYTSLQICYT